MEKPRSHTHESVEEKLARERAEAREELKHADMDAFDRVLRTLVKIPARDLKPKPRKDSR